MLEGDGQVCESRGSARIYGCAYQSYSKLIIQATGNGEDRFLEIMGAVQYAELALGSSCAHGSGQSAVASKGEHQKIPSSIENGTPGV